MVLTTKQPLCNNSFGPFFCAMARVKQAISLCPFVRVSHPFVAFDVLQTNWSTNRQRDGLNTLYKFSVECTHVLFSNCSQYVQITDLVYCPYFEFYWICNNSAWSTNSKQNREYKNRIYNSLFGKFIAPLSSQIKFCIGVENKRPVCYYCFHSKNLYFQMYFGDIRKRKYHF